MSSDGARPQYLTVAEVAETIRVSRMTVYRLVHSGELPAIRVGKSYRVPEEALTEYLRQPAADLSDRDQGEERRSS